MSIRGSIERLFGKTEYQCVASSSVSGADELSINSVSVFPSPWVGRGIVFSYFFTWIIVRNILCLVCIDSPWIKEYSTAVGFQIACLVAEIQGVFYPGVFIPGRTHLPIEAYEILPARLFGYLQSIWPSAHWTPDGGIYGLPLSVLTSGVAWTLTRQRVC